MDLQHKPTRSLLLMSATLLPKQTWQRAALDCYHNNSHEFVDSIRYLRLICGGYEKS